jgi:hypothetical protein
MSKYGHNNATKKARGWNVPEPVVLPEINPQGRIDLDPSKFDLLIQQKGIVAKVYRTLYCPNVKSCDGAEHEIDCTFCNGSGFLDVDPICVYVFIQTQELDKLPNVEGFVDGNTVLITFPIGVEMQYFTKIELHDFTEVYPQRVLRKPGALTDILKYPACRVNVLIDRNQIRYFQEMDFTLDLNGNVKWLTAGDQQKVAFSAVPDSGSFTLTFGSFTTAPIPFNASAAQVEAALELTSVLANVTVTGDFTTGFKVTFVGVDSPVALLTSSSSLAHGVTPVTIAVTDVAIAARKPNDNEPYSIHYEARVQYRAKMAVHSNRFTQFATGNQIQHVKMNEQWYCAKEFLVKLTDKFTAVELQQGPYDAHKIVIEDGGDPAGSGSGGPDDSD